eukprot:2497407-Amphidinium_carterae.1
MLKDREGRGAGKERSNEVKYSPDGADGTPYLRSGRSDQNPQMVRENGSTRTSGQDGKSEDDDGDKDGAVRMMLGCANCALRHFQVLQ